MCVNTLIKIDYRNFGAQSDGEFSLCQAVRAPIGDRALRLEPRRPGGWSDSICVSRIYLDYGDRGNGRQGRFWDQHIVVTSLSLV